MFCVLGGGLPADGVDFHKSHLWGNVMRQCYSCDLNECPLFPNSNINFI